MSHCKFFMYISALIMSLLPGNQVVFAQNSLTDVIVNKRAANKPLFPWGTGRIATYGGLSVFAYRSASLEDWLYLHDNTGNESHIQLPNEFSEDERASAEYILTSPTEFWLWSLRSGRCILSHYQLRGNGSLPTKAALISTMPVGNYFSRPGALIRLASGGILGVWNQLEQHDDRHITVGFIYRSPTGVLSGIYPLSGKGVEGTPLETRWALAQHPADGSIWAFYKRDSYHEISVIHLSETDSGIKFDWIDTGFISHKEGINEPEGEFPFLIAAPDYRRKTIRLAYQNSSYRFFYVADGNGVYYNGSCSKLPSGKLEPNLFV